MPSTDTPVRRRVRSGQLARALLVVAVGGPLLGLAVSSSAATTATAPAAVDMLRPTVAVAPAVVTLPVLRLPARASRSRSLSSALWFRPVAAAINSPYGPRWGSWHPGVDFGARYGTPIHVVADGTVIGAGYLPNEGGYGQIVLVRHPGGFITAYAHTSRYFVHAGQHVTRGQVIGLVGATGHVTGPHLHFEVRVNGVKVNPVPWLRRHGIRV